MMVFSVADIAQHGHVLSFGPSTHEDERATEMGAAFVKDFLQLVLRSIHSGQFPVSWSSTLIKEIMRHLRLQGPTKLCGLGAQVRARRLR